MLIIVFLLLWYELYKNFKDAINIKETFLLLFRFPRWHSGRESDCQWKRCKRCAFNTWVRKIPWRRKWQPTPIFLPGKFQELRSLAAYSSWGDKELDMTEQLNMHGWFFKTENIIIKSNKILLLKSKSWSQFD